MKKSNKTETLKDAIILLKLKQNEDLIVLKNQYHITTEHLKPVNLMKSALHQVSSSSEIKGAIASKLIGLGSGFLTKRVLFGSSNGVFKKVFGTVLQLVVTNFVANKTEQAIEHKIAKD